MHPTAKIFMEQQWEQGGASWGDALPISAPSCLLSLQPGGEVCMSVTVGERGRRQTRRQRLGTQTGDKTGELGYVR